jgi:hypothetical protein
VWVATGADGQVAGVVTLAPGDGPGTLDLNKLFIDPRHIRGGVGRALLVHAIAQARRRGAERLTIRADPNAAGFYERSGAVRIGDAPSDAARGRRSMSSGWVARDDCHGTRWGTLFCLLPLWLSPALRDVKLHQRTAGEAPGAGSA